MTLVVSEVSRHGIVMVGDSAVTHSRDARIVRVEPGAQKVQYSSAANIGITMWGWGQAGNQRLDLWVSEFMKSEAQSGVSIETLGTLLAQQLNRLRQENNVPMDETTRSGFHLAGYENGCPRLWHVHTGHYHEPVHEFRLYRDFPEGQGLSPDQALIQIEQGVLNFHLRNGYHQIFGLLFENVLSYSRNLRNLLRVEFPADTVEGRVQFNKLLVRSVADTLEASGLHPIVNNILSTIAFNQDRLLVDERIPIDVGSGAMEPGDLIGFMC